MYFGEFPMYYTILHTTILVLLYYFKCASLGRQEELYKGFNGL